MTLKIAVITANIGNFDEKRTPPLMEGVDFFYYTEENLPAPLPNLNNRLKGKYIKTQPHRFLPHDIFIWLDASVEILSADLITHCIAELSDGNDVVISHHAERHNVYDELHYIQKLIVEGNQYVIDRYAKEPLQEELDFYSREGMPDEFALFNCYCFARKNNFFVNSVFDDWWNGIIQYCNFDQTMFSYVAWKNNLRIGNLNHELIKRHAHK